MTSSPPSPAVPHVETRAAQPYVGVTRTVTMATIQQIADRIPEVISTLLGQGMVPGGAPFLRYRVIDMSRELVIEAGVPVPAAPERIDGLDRGTLPAGRYAVVVHHGHPDGLLQAIPRLLDWAEEQGLAFDVTPTEAGEAWGCRLETYLSNPDEVPDLDDWDTELAFRLAD